MLLAICVLFVLPSLDLTLIRSARFNPYYATIFWFFIFNFFFLVYLGGQPVENIYLFFSRLCTTLYFSFFCLFIPLLGIFDILAFFADDKK